MASIHSSWRSTRNALKRIAPLRAAVRAIRERVERKRESAWILAGQERHSQQPLTVFVAGSPDTRNYIARLAFGESCVETDHSRIWRSRLLRRACAGSGPYDLAIVQSDQPQPVNGPAAAMFQAPCWIGGEKDLRAAPELARHNKQVKKDIDRVRKNGFDYRVTSAAEEFERFYHGMYLPHVSRVFGEGACLMVYEEMQAAIPRSELLLITRDGQDIAGGILVYDGNERVRGWSTGVKDGDGRWVKAGALAAYDCLRMSYLAEKGLKRLHVGASRPFLSDGVLSFKKARGMEITDRTRQSFLILPRRDSAGMRAFLQHNPFIYDDAGTLKGALFVPEQVSVEAAAGLFHDWYVPGLDCLTVFCPDQDSGRDLRFRACGRIDGAGRLTSVAGIHNDPGGLTA